MIGVRAINVTSLCDLSAIPKTDRVPASPLKFAQHLAICLRRVLPLKTARKIWTKSAQWATKLRADNVYHISCRARALSPVSNLMIIKNILKSCLGTWQNWILISIVPTGQTNERKCGSAVLAFFRFQNVRVRTSNGIPVEWADPPTGQSYTLMNEPAAYKANAQPLRMHNVFLFSGVIFLVISSCLEWVTPRKYEGHHNNGGDIQREHVGETPNSQRPQTPRAPAGSSRGRRESNALSCSRADQTQSISHCWHTVIAGPCCLATQSRQTFGVGAFFFSNLLSEGRSSAPPRPPGGMIERSLYSPPRLTAHILSFLRTLRGECVLVKRWRLFIVGTKHSVMQTVKFNCCFWQ